jgi:hypothetical protein
MQPWLEANSTNISICFKPFTTAFRKQRDATMARSRFLFKIEGNKKIKTE